MERQDTSISCGGLLFRAFQHSKDRNNGAGSVVALTSPHEGCGVSQITNALAEELRRDGDQPAISLFATELGDTDSGRSTQRNLSNAVETIRRKYRYALIDCGSIKTTPNAIRLAPLVDGIILVLEANRTQTEQILYAERTLEGVNGRILGHVLNKRTYVIPEWIHRMMGHVGI
jgi:Mrp family chromosome partitioning ATPase